MDPATMMLIAQGAVKAGQAGSRLFQPRFQNSRYGRLLRDRKKQGNLTPGQEMNVLGRTATTATKQANLANRRYTGSLINKGMEGSVSAQRGLREAEADVRRTVANTGKDIYQSEEQAKSKAKLDYARAMDQDKAERTQAGLGVLSAGIETAGNLYGQKVQDQQAQDQSYMDAMNKYGRAVAYDTPSGKTRYKGGFDPSTGSQLTLDDKRAVEVYAQKANIKNSTAVSDTFESYLSGETEPDKFLEKMTSLGLSDEQIIELMKQLSQ
tara:strand:- start:1565 stop:2365 length:801 start_codon:yes stop_codon:yes gene_type:complete